VTNLRRMFTGDMTTLGLRMSRPLHEPCFLTGEADDIAETCSLDFFYGTIMDPAVMKDFGVSVTEVYPAKLPGFDLVIRPQPNLARSNQAVVFGSLMAVTHDDLMGQGETPTDCITPS